MSLIVENGTLVPGANSYADLATADGFHLEFGNENWAGLEPPKKEHALRRATIFVDYSFSSAFKGQRLSGHQSLEWPRQRVLDATGHLLPSAPLPEGLINATCEAALLTANPSTDPLPLVRDPMTLPRVISIPHTIRKEFHTPRSLGRHGTAAFRSSYPRLEQWLAPLLRHRPSSSFRQVPLLRG